MHKIVEFIRSIYVFLLFVIIEIIATVSYANSSYYTQAKLLNSANYVFGGVYNTTASIGHYFSLKGENETLLNRVIELEQSLLKYKSADVLKRLDDYMIGNTNNDYELMTAHVVSNSVNKSKNFIIINKGIRDDVTVDMAVVSPSGAMVGYVVDCTERYSVVISILNTSFRASGKLDGKNYFGSIVWDGSDKHRVYLSELSKYAIPQVGEEVVSTDFSHNFPEDVLIGTVVGAELNETQTLYTVEVELAADISSLEDVILVRNNNTGEIEQLKSGESRNSLSN